MGYMLPVNFYQYTQYQRREVTKKNQSNRSPDKVFRIELEKLKDYDQQPRNEKIEFYQRKNSKINAHELEELTGKGRNFSETV